MACASACSTVVTASGYSLRTVDVAFAGADGISGEDHALQNGVRVAFEDAAIHERAWIAFVGVTYNVFLIGLDLRRERPFLSGGESRAAASANAGFRDLFDHLGGRHLCERAQGAAIGAPGDRFLDAHRINGAAIAQNNALLAAIEGDFVEFGNLCRIRLAGFV